jgi:uncharacterized membrane protein
MSACGHSTIVMLYLMWFVSLAKTWPLTIFNACYLYTLLQTVVRVANAATSVTPSRAADAIMTAGAILLPDIAFLLIGALVVIVACLCTILSEFYSPTRETNNPRHRYTHRPSPIQQWIVRRMADAAAIAVTAIESLTVRRRHT